MLERRPARWGLHCRAGSPVHPGVRRLPNSARSVGCTAGGAGHIVLGLPGDVPFKVFGAALAALGSGCVGPYLGNLLLDRAAPAVRGRAAGLLFSATFVGDFLNPLAVTPLRLAFGIHGAFIGIGSMAVAGALWVMLRARSHSDA